MPIDLMAPLASASVRAAGPGLVTFAGLWLFRIRSSAARHAAWTAVIAGMLLQIPLGLVAPKVPLKALSTLPAHIKLREREWAQISVPTATILSSASRTLTKPKARPMSFRYALTGLYLAISMLLFIRMALGYRGLRRILRDARPVRRGSGSFRIGLTRGTRFGGVLPAEDSSAASLEGLGGGKASRRTGA